jgi:hypothetical protein
MKSRKSLGSGRRSACNENHRSTVDAPFKVECAHLLRGIEAAGETGLRGNINFA